MASLCTIGIRGESSHHIKSTLVDQKESSRYECTEVRLGAEVSRHELLIHQLGPETKTVLKHFIFAGKTQLHDLHSKLQLDYHSGAVDQLHKSIVTHTGHSIFDGNVKVNQLAQKTDAKQLSRNLLISPRSTANIKPNLQIIADDVKCTHGCAVSDLSNIEIFYLTSRGIKIQTARQALIDSFGLEVIRQLKYPALRNRIESAITTRSSSILHFDCM